MMMTRPIKFSLLPTSSPVAVFLLHLLEANPRLCAASNNDLVIYCQFVWSCYEMFHLQKTSLIFTQLNQTWVIELFLGYFVFSFNVRSLALFFCFLLNVCDHALFTEPALCCCSLRTRTRAGALLHTSTQSLRFSEKLMYLHLKIYLFLRSHQFLNNINFKLADKSAFCSTPNLGGKWRCVGWPG